MQGAVPCPLQSASLSPANLVSFIALTQEGKTTILHHLAAIGLVTPDEYEQLHRDWVLPPRPKEDLEASVQLR